MSKILLFILSCVFVFSCAPVKFSRSDNFNVNPNQNVGGNPNQVVCEPRINSSLTTYTYSGSENPSIVSQCNPSNVNYDWVVKRADSSIVNTAIPGLSGQDPSNVDFRVLGAGVYYVFLNATDGSGQKTPYVASTPLEFVVPGTGVGNSLTCDPKLNSTYSSVVVNSTDANPTVAANCTPAASSYIWTVYKESVQVSILGLSGANSTPDFKSFGPGEYKVYLYATSTGSAHWQSSSALTVTVSPGVVPPISLIQCNPRINGSLTSLVLTAASPNPLISGNCHPSSVQYAWSVTKNGQGITVPGLSGSNSNPNFLNLGVGTYLISLVATKANSTTWSTSTPLQITVDTGGGGNTLNCAPRLNGTAVAVTVPLNGTNPVVTSGCDPSSVTHAWSVYKNGQPVTISGLAGASSTGQFISSGLGTYLVYLTASASGYNTYVSPSPLAVTVANNGSDLRVVNYSDTIQTTDNKVDILLVVDDSNSMSPENTKLAERLQGFVADLSTSGIDWQMCATVTRAQNVNGDGILYWGASRNWVNYLGSVKWILKAGAPDPYSIFTSTISAIGAGWAGTDDERAIKAAYWHAEYSQYNTCYRNDASLAVILLSDEDERSVGGNAQYQYYTGEYKPLEGDDIPSAYVNKIKQKFGQDKLLSVNSIVVRPGDAACMNSQDANGAKSHYGYKYNELAHITNGYTASICASDYSTNLNYFKYRIVSSRASINLECAPVGDVVVQITPAMGSVSTAIVNNTIVFTPAIPAGRTVQLQYNCSQN